MFTVEELARFIVSKSNAKYLPALALSAAKAAFAILEKGDTGDPNLRAAAPVKINAVMLARQIAAQQKIPFARAQQIAVRFCPATTRGQATRAEASSPRLVTMTAPEGPTMTLGDRAKLIARTRGVSLAVAQRFAVRERDAQHARDLRELHGEPNPRAPRFHTAG